MDKWEAGSQLEGLTCNLELLQDLLEILHNEMDEEREVMELTDNPGLAKRQRTLQSLLIAAIRGRQVTSTPSARACRISCITRAAKNGKQTESKRKANCHRGRAAAFPLPAVKNFWAKQDFCIGAFLIINGGVKQRARILRRFLQRFPMGLRPTPPVAGLFKYGLRPI